MSDRAAIAVLLATYNGERFLAEQLDSLWRQTRQDFEVVVRDDGSTDGTRELLERAAEQRPGRLKVVDDGAGRLGPMRSFARLLEATSARYVAFCDQDDHWLPGKLARQVDAIAALEAQHGSDAPTLCCSDATLVDGQLRPLGASYFERHNVRAVDGRDRTLPRLLFRNFAIGATTMLNASLVERCRGIPDAAMMHDWWCALVAAVVGRTVVLREPQLLYRQHAGNAIGSKLRRWPRSVRQAQEYLAWSRASSARCVRQAAALREHCGDALSPRTRLLLDRYASFAGQSPLQRASTLLRTRAFKPGIALNGLHLYACATASFAAAA